MTPILYDGSTIVGYLIDATTCVVTEERNGIYEMALTYPVTGPLFGEIKIDRYIKAKPNDTANLQLFRIYEVTKPISGIVTVNCEHVSYALSHYPITSISADKRTAYQAVSAVMAAATAYMPTNPFVAVDTGWSATRSTYHYLVGSARAALGGSDGSVLDVYGGEYEWDNYTIKLHQHRGTDTGVIIAYRKNMTDLKVTTSLETAYTALYPYAIKDDNLITITGGTIPVQNTSGISERVLIRDFSGDFGDADITPSALQTKAQTYLTDNDINAPSMSMSVSFVHLWQSPEYASVRQLEMVSLCDTVTVRHEGLGVDVKLKVIKTVYDAIAERYQSIDLGSPRANFASTIQQATATLEHQIQRVEAGTSAITQAYTQAISNATAAITGASGGYVVLNPSLNPQEIYILEDSPDISTAQHYWRWNSGGLGYTDDGGQTYGTAMVAGAINASLITTGSLNANLITAGVLQSSDGLTSFNLQSGLLTANNVDITGGVVNFGYGINSTVYSSAGAFLSSTYINETNHVVGSLSWMAYASGSFVDHTSDVFLELCYHHMSTTSGMFTAGINGVLITAYDTMGVDVQTDEHGIKHASATKTYPTQIALFNKNRIEFYKDLYIGAIKATNGAYVTTTNLIPETPGNQGTSIGYSDSRFGYGYFNVLNSESIYVYSTIDRQYHSLRDWIVQNIRPNINGQTGALESI